MIIKTGLKVLVIFFLISLKAYRIEPLISEDYSSIEPVKLHRYDSPKFGYNESKKPSGSGWAGKLFSGYRSKAASVSFKKSTQAPERQSSSSAEESESTGDEGLVIVDQGPLSDEGRVLGAEGGMCSTDGAAGRSLSLSNDNDSTIMTIN